SVWEPGLVETATVPGRIIWRERVTKTLFKEHRDYVKTWHLLDGRLYKYEASLEPLLAGWKSIETCLNGRIVDVFFLGERGWVISEKGAIGITSNSGKQWKSYQLGFDGSFAALFFLDDSNGWVVMNSRTVLTTRDGGVTWGRIGDGFPETRITQLHFDDLNRGWAVAQGYKSPLFTSDGGKTWSMP